MDDVFFTHVCQFLFSLSMSPCVSCLIYSDLKSFHEVFFDATHPIDWDADLYAGSDRGWLHGEEAFITRFSMASMGGEVCWYQQTQLTRVRIKPHPFSKGSMRLAYYMEEMVSGGSPKRWVAKESQRRSIDENCPHYFMCDIHMQLKAKEIADAMRSKININKNVDYIIPAFLQFKNQKREGERT